MANLQTFERTDYQQVKSDLHRKILDRLTWKNSAAPPVTRLGKKFWGLIRSAVNSEACSSQLRRARALSREILDEIFGLGPLEPLLKDPTISDILVNRYDQVYVERGRQTGSLPAFVQGRPALDADHRPHRVPQSDGASMSPRPWWMPACRMAHASTPSFLRWRIDGARALHPPLWPRPADRPRLAGQQAITGPMLELLAAMVKGRLNLIISGGTGAGKTTLLNVLSGVHPQRSASSPSKTQPNCS